MKYETIDKYQIDDLMARKPVRDPQGWDDRPRVVMLKPMRLRIRAIKKPRSQ